MSIPIRVLTEDAPDESLAGENGVGYVIAKNGNFIAVRNDVVSAIVPTREIGAMRDQRPLLDWKLPPLPADLIYQIAKFFREVRDMHKTEVAVLLHYGDGEWAVTVPDQVVAAAHVDYNLDDFRRHRLPGKRMVGTMHSHVDMRASHSGVDVRDEEQFDGLHVTIGRVDELPRRLDFSVEVVVRGHRFTVDLAEVAEGFYPAAAEVEDESLPVWKRSWRSGPSHSVSDEVAYQAVEVPAEWHDPVTAHRWGGGNWGHHRHRRGHRH